MTNKLRPFNLEAALKGEPVMLRDGSKAFVRHHETEVNVADNRRLIGAVILDDERATLEFWNQNGKYGFLDGVKRVYDIIGMYQKTRTINGFEVPAPETEELKVGSVYYIPMLQYSDYFTSDRWSGGAFEIELRLKRDLVFLNKEDAIANAKAMLGIDPYEEDKSDE